MIAGIVFTAGSQLITGSKDSGSPLSRERMGIDDTGTCEPSGRERLYPPLSAWATVLLQVWVFGPDVGVGFRLGLRVGLRLRLRLRLGVGFFYALQT